MKENALSEAQLMKEYKILVLGAGGADLVVQFIQGYAMDEDDPTIEETNRKVCMIDDEAAILDVLDPVGQEHYAAVREQYLHTGDGFLFVYSITSRNSFERVSTFYQQILRIKGGDSFPAIIVGHNCELGYERQVSVHEGRDLAKRFGCKFIETSVKERINVDEVFINLVREIRKYNEVCNRPICIYVLQN